MDKPYTYVIRVEGCLSDQWIEWFGGLSIANDSNCETVLSGIFEDQAALIGTLAKIQGLNLILISVCRRSEKNHANKIG